MKPFKKFSMYNGNEETTASSGTTMSGEKTDLSGIKFRHEELEEEIAALKEAIIELIPMAEQARDNLPVNAHPAVAMLMNKRIERAKKLLNKQPQSESDGDKDLSD